MSKLPKLKIILPFGYAPESICDFEEAKHRLFYAPDLLVFVEGHVIYSYEELVQIASQDRYKDKEFLEVVLTHLIDGG